MKYNVRESITDFFGPRCVKNCPKHLFEDNENCVWECPPDKKDVNGKCVPCNGTCTGVCHFSGILHGGNIAQ